MNLLNEETKKKHEILFAIAKLNDEGKKTCRKNRNFCL